MDKRCHINNKIHLNLANKFSDEFEEREREGIRSEIRTNLCDDLQTYKHTDENYYCIFHLPNKDKNLTEFRETSAKKINKIKQQIAKVNELPDDKKQSEKAKIKYDFRYVRFPCAFGFRLSKVEVEINFSHATFFDVADFMSTEFLGYANFDSVTFHKIAYFKFAKFRADSYFYSANFLGEADFKYTFFSNGKFSNVTFSEIADFESSEFAKHANFINVSFKNKACFRHSKLFIANFENAKFSDLTDFNSAQFLHYGLFRGNSDNLLFSEKAILDLRDVRIEKPEIISFHTVRLCPSWFINADARKIDFTDVIWENIDDIDVEKVGLDKEVDSLTNLGVNKPIKALNKAITQLTENAEANRRLEEAQKFKKLILALKKLSCHIHDLADPSQKVDVRRSICQDLPVVNIVDGNNYCLLHLPTKEKDKSKFEQIFNARLEAIEDEISKIEKLPKNKRREAKLKIIYDFRYVWFPDKANFSGKRFLAKTDFNSAVFSEGVTFTSTIFYEPRAEFISTTFMEFADFRNAIFLADADFRAATFSGYAYFVSAIFGKKGGLVADFSQSKFKSPVDFRKSVFKTRASFVGAEFSSSVFFRSANFYSETTFLKATFKANANFIYTTFWNEVVFVSANFEETSQIRFNTTRFKGDASFGMAIVRGWLYFEAGNGKFSDGSTKTLVFEKDLDFAYIRAEKPERIIFNKVRLHPSWFVNADTREFVFVDIAWRNHKDGKTDIEKEINTLVERSYEKPHNYRLLTISFRNLATNAEEFNRFEEASNFRQMAFETEWLEKKEKISNWVNHLVPESEKLKKRFGGSNNEEDKPNPPTTSFGILRRSGDFVIHGLYRITSFYGESWSWAAFVLAFIIFAIFPLIYTQTEFQVTPKNIPLEIVVKDCKDVVEELKPVCKIENRGLDFWSESIPHSLATATLQTVEYRVPKTPWGSIWMILEKIFAPLQAALLALAIRRKFMR